jgi:hypothetical protein
MLASKRHRTASLMTGRLRSTAPSLWGPRDCHGLDLAVLPGWDPRHATASGARAVLPS